MRTMKQYLNETYRLKLPPVCSFEWLHKMSLPATLVCHGCGKQVRIENVIIGPGTRPYCQTCADARGGVTC